MTFREQVSKRWRVLYGRNTFGRLGGRSLLFPFRIVPIKLGGLPWRVTVQYFDEYVSLGYNCEVGFQIRRILGHDEVSYFSWGIFHIDSIIDLIEKRFCNVFQREALTWDASHQLPRETKFDFAFHGPWASGSPIDDPEFETSLNDHLQKADHLAKKFLRPGVRRLYLCKPMYTQPKEKIDRLAKLLTDISPQSTMVLLRLSYETSSNASHPMIVERVLKHAAPADAADKAHEPSWDRIFAEFPRKTHSRLEAVSER